MITVIYSATKEDLIDGLPILFYLEFLTSDSERLVVSFTPPGFKLGNYGRLSYEDYSELVATLDAACRRTLAELTVAFGDTESVARVDQRVTRYYLQLDPTLGDLRNRMITQLNTKDYDSLESARRMYDRRCDILEMLRLAEQDVSREFSIAQRELWKQQEALIERGLKAQTDMKRRKEKASAARSLAVGTFIAGSAASIAASSSSETAYLSPALRTCVRSMVTQDGVCESSH